MRQSHLILLIISNLCFVALTGCATTTIDEFSKIKEGMNKDQVLEIVGSPTRTERFDGKEKWAYRYWAGPEKDVEQLRQVTFLNGKVLSVGDDKDELERIKEINESDDQRAARRKAAKAAHEHLSPADLAAPNEAGVSAASPTAGAASTAASITTVNDPDKELRDYVAPFVPKESDFVEVKGKRSAPKSPDDDSESQDQ